LPTSSPLGQLAAFIEQRIRHVYRRQRSTPFPSRTAKSRHQSQLGVDGLDVAHLATLNDSFLNRRVKLAVAYFVDDFLHLADGILPSGAPVLHTG
jgi:hypothetical protein